MNITNENTMVNRHGLLPRIALIACGSFSPPTPMHFRMFEIARDYFEMNGTHHVIGGIVSPTHDSYGKNGLAPANDRYAMLKLALKSSSWIRVSDWELLQPQWSRTSSVLQYHQNYMNNYINSPDTEELKAYSPSWLPMGLRDRRDPVQLKLLCGADLLESFAVPGLWADKDIEDIIANHGLVVITRNGTNPEKFVFDSDVLTKYQRNITMITNWVPNEVSSSLIRRLLSRGQSVKYLIDDAVLEYIKTNYLFNWKSKYITELTHPTPNNIYNLAFIKQVNMSASARKHLLTGNDNDNDNEDEDDNDNTNENDNKNDDDNDDDDDSGALDVEHMDESATETDYSIKSILTSMNLDNRQAKVFCCGEREKSTATKLLPQRTRRPGQAVQVITTERSIIGSSANASRIKERLAPLEVEQMTSKKMKITDAQQV